MGLETDLRAQYYLEEAFQNSTLSPEAVSAVLSHAPSFLELMITTSQSFEPEERRFVFVFAAIQDDEILKTPQRIGGKFLNPLELLRHNLSQEVKITGGSFGLVNKGIKLAYELYLKDLHSRQTHATH